MSPALETTVSSYACTRARDSLLFIMETQRGAADFYKLLDSFSFCDRFTFSFVQNGHLIINKFLEEKKNKIKTVNFFASGVGNMNKDAFRIHLRKIYCDVERFKKCLRNETQWMSLKALLETQYKIPIDSSVPAPTPVSLVSMPLDSSTPTPTPVSLVSMPLDSSTPTPTPASLVSVPCPTPPPINFITPPKRRLRSDCKTCAKRRLQMANISTKNSHMKEAVRKARKRVAHNKTLQQKVTRKEEVEAGLRKERQSLKKRVKVLESSDNSSLTSTIRVLKRALNSKNKELARAYGQIQIQSANIMSLQKELRDFKISNDYLVSLIGEQGNEPEEKMLNGLQFKRQVRKVVYKSLLCHVPVAHSGALLSYTLRELGDGNKCKVPHKSTVARMAYELSALSSIQAAGALLASDCATLCWDATTLDGTHINEVHISSPQCTFTISVARLPGGRATDYVDHISATVDELAGTYAAYSGDDFFAIKSNILSKISSTISDRAPVNHCVVQQLRGLYESDLLELNIRSWTEKRGCRAMAVIVVLPISSTASQN